MNKLTIAEVGIIIVAIIFGIRWMIDPNGQFEPIIAFCAILISGLDLWRRHSTETIDKTKVTHEIIESNDSANTNENIENETGLPTFKLANSCAFFEQRFSQAFPGLRQTKCFEGKQAVERLQILLAQPLKFSLPDGGWITPIGWQRDGNMTIDDFKVIDDNTVIIDCKELKVKRICAVYMSNYKQMFVYLEADKMPAIGVYEHTEKSINEAIDYYGYAWEEYGLYKNTHPITRAEYDDNAAIIMGKPVNLKGECEIRIRYLTPYNMIISASSSSLNQSLFDERLKTYMNRMLKGEDCMDDFINEVKSLPSALGY